MMLQHVKKYLGINPPQPRRHRDDLPTAAGRRVLKKRHTRAVRRMKIAIA